MRDNPVQFAVVREDPEIEAAVVRAAKAERALLIASGGCTALSLARMTPSVALTLVDPNPAQLAHVREKRDALASGAPLSRFNVGDANPDGLNACGNFESLFRGLSELLFDLVAPEATWVALIRGQIELAQVLDDRYWPLAFELYFSDAMLHAMFGTAATQHAPPGSYPTYFRRLFERGLAAADARDNYFLHHAILGRYLEHALPPYLAAASVGAGPIRYEEVPGFVADVPDLSRFDVVSISNITDWMSAGERASLGATLMALKPGAWVIVRQLNNDAGLEEVLRGFLVDEAWSRRLLDADRSLFYSSVRVARRRGEVGTWTI